MKKTRKPKTPSYRCHKSSNQAVVTLNGRDVYLGRYGTPASKQEYDRVIGEWLANGRRLPATHGEGLTISELIAAYRRHAALMYQADTNPNGEYGKIKLALRPLRKLYGASAAVAFGPLALKAVRETFVAEGAGRKYVNDQIGRIKRMFKWATENEIVPPTVFHALQAVSGLRRGRTGAPEGKRVIPVPDEYVAAIQPFVSPQVWALVQLQLLTGLRPSEALSIRACDLDMSGRIWLYTPQSHKTENFGHERVIELGPRAQVVIRPFLSREIERFLFRPADAVSEQRRVRHANRKTPLSHGNRPGTNRKRNPLRSPGAYYTAASYRRAIHRACDRADREARRAKHTVHSADERVVPRWNPYRLRHNFATAIRRQFGIEAARVLCGHKTLAITQFYGEVDRAKVRSIVEQVG